MLLQSIQHRGPDDEGICLISRKNKEKRLYRTERTRPEIEAALSHIDDNKAFLIHDVALIHTRYSIIDVTEGGHQPFVSWDESIIAIFNGEVYNYIELRAVLSSIGVRFRTSSDTEVLVEGYRIWKDELWSKLNGFWAVALYDQRNDSIVLSRDRIGVAPLYYRECEDGMYFASSIQPLIDIDPPTIDVDYDKVLGFIETGMKDFDNSTFYCQVKSIPTGTTVTFNAGKSKLADSKKFKYWDFPSSRLKTVDLPFAEAVTRYRETFFSAVELRLRADVTVAFELSGGLDSSSIVAVAALLRNNNITTYTIKVDGHDEEPYARSILERYAVDYRVLCDPEETFVRDVDWFSRVMEEPYHSPNIYTHFKMRQEMKSQGVSVVLSGSGGDEVMAGYEDQYWPMALMDLRRNGHFWHAMSYEVARKFMSFERSKRTFRDGFERVKQRIHRYGVHPIQSIRDRVMVETSDASKHNAQLAIKARALFYQKEYRELSFHDQAVYHFKVAMIPYWLRSNDHFTMAIPLEHRFPFLDYRIVELGLQMPSAYLFKNGWTKYVMRKAMQAYLPEKIVWRKEKMGFPFAYRRFLAANRPWFEPVFENARKMGMSSSEYGDYELLLKTNPVKLWRLVSAGLWVEGLGDKCLSSTERVVSA